MNFEGIGNRVMLFPILRATEQSTPDFQYFTTGDLLPDLQDRFPSLRLERHLGSTPSIWRRFDLDHSAAIRKFVQENEIGLIVNLRNEDRDSRYDRFRETHSGIATFLNLAEVVERYPKLKDNTLRMCAVFREFGFDLSHFRRDWLREVMPPQGASNGTLTIGLFTGASQTVKRWPALRWLALARRLVDLPAVELRLYGGLSDEEIDLACQVERTIDSFELARQPIRWIRTPRLIDLVGELAQLDLLVSNDSLPLHLATALDLPAVGLYFATDSSIWGGIRDSLVVVQSKTGLDCPMMKPSMGSCAAYYGGCPGPCADDITAEHVWNAVLTLLRRLQHFNVNGEIVSSVLSQNNDEQAMLRSAIP